jgi:hypothetical protein
MRGECPKCGSKSTFSVSRINSELKYICFSASCGLKGIITSKGGDAPALDQKVIRHSKLFNGTLTALHQHEVDWLADTFRIAPEWLSSVRFSEQDYRVYYPQYDVMGRVFGYIARHYPHLAGEPTRGAKAYWKQVIAGEVGLLFPNMDVMAQVVKEQRVLVVEDYPSMLRINSQMGIPTCCLGGTNIYTSHLDTMISMGVKELIILLDADAVVKAVKLKRGLSLAFENVTVIPLTGSDPKDMAYDELEEILNASRVTN